MNICIFGSSIAWGASDSEKGGWVERLKIYLAEKNDDEVYNLGVSGDTSTKLLKRIEVEAAAREPNMILFAIGINDSQYIHSTNSQRTSIDDFKQNLEKLYTIAQKFTDKIIFIGLTPVDESKTTPIPWNIDKSYTMENIKKYNNLIENFCMENDIKFIAMDTVINNNDLYDGLHPSSIGHKKMFEKIKREIE